MRKPTPEVLDAILFKLVVLCALGLWIALGLAK
jgi:hypothetical protein